MKQHAKDYCGECSLILQDPTLTIQVDSSILYPSPSAGVIDTEYEITLRAENIPSDITEVTFEWTPGHGAGGSEVATVFGGVAEISVPVMYAVPGQHSFSATVRSEASQLAEATIQINIWGPTLSIDPPGLTNANANEEYTFVFLAKEIPVSKVTFEWSFGDGYNPNSIGSSEEIAITNFATASTQAHYTYSEDGAYGLVVAVNDAITGTVLAQASVNVVVGTGSQRNFVLEDCDDWSVADQGGYGVTIDDWDISLIAPNAVFDVEFDAYYVPDKFIIEYPTSNVVLNTGWRGYSDWYDGDALYPGGVTDPGKGSVENVFSKISPNEFRITIVGPDEDTLWEYKVKCRNM